MSSWEFLKKNISEEVSKVSGADVSNLLEEPEEYGDIALPCFSMKIDNKAPAEAAEYLAGKLKIPGIKEIKASGPYINFLVEWSSFGNLLLKEIKEGYGSQNQKKKIVLEYSGPNVGKPMHVGHIRSTILGDSLFRTLSFLGNKTTRINYLGDSGAHIGKLIVALELWGKESEIEKNPEKEMLKLYVKFNEESEKNPDLEKRALDVVEKLEKKSDKKLLSIWKKIRDWSLFGFEKSYKKLSIEFDEISGESFFDEEGREIVEELLKRGIATKIEGDAVEVGLKKYGLENLIVLRTGGTTLYSTWDLALAKYKHEKYGFDLSIYVVGSEQKLHFQQIFKTLEILGYDWAKNCVHLPFGLLFLEEGKMSSRKGRVIFLEDVIKKAEEIAYEVVKGREDLSENEKKKISSSVGIGALKYSILKTEPNKEIKFDWGKALSFEGGSGPYIQYTHARASSILKRADKNVNFDAKHLSDERETKIISMLAKYPEILSRAGSELRPHRIAMYLLYLSDAFNEFYQSIPVLQAEPQQRAARLSLVKAVKTVLKSGLELLGIEALEKM